MARVTGTPRGLKPLSRRWNKGAFEEASEGAEGAPTVVLSAHKQQRAELDANTLRHAAGLPAQHAIGERAHGTCQLGPAPPQSHCCGLPRPCDTARMLSGQ
jgi:hypothetical protein